MGAYLLRRLIEARQSEIKRGSTGSLKVTPQIIRHLIQP